MLIHSVGAIEVSPEMITSNVSSLQAVDLNQLDQIEEPDNIFASASVNFMEMIQSMHNDQKNILNIVSTQDQLTPDNLIKTQMLMEDYQNCIGLTSTVIKQVNKAVDSLTHIQ